MEPATWIKEYSKYLQSKESTEKKVLIFKSYLEMKKHKHIESSDK